MTVTSDAATSGDKELKTDWPFTEGTELGTTKLADEPYLEPEELDLTEHWGSI